MATRPPRPDASRRWLGVYWLCFAACVAATGLLVLSAPRLTRFGLTGYAVYVVLVPLGLGASGFLFGALRSLAQYEGRFWFGALRLGGPVVVFALVVMGGLLFGAPPETFQLVAHVQEAETGEPVRQGSVRVALGQDTRVAPIDAQGSAYFPEIPAKFRGRPVEARAEIAGYRIKSPGPRPVSEEGVVTLEVEKVPVETAVSGKVLAEGGGPLAGVTIDVENGLAVAESDTLGNFRVRLPLPAGARVRVMATRRGEVGFDDFQLLPGPWTISYRK